MSPEQRLHPDPEPEPAPAGSEAQQGVEARQGFEVTLDNFSGPFDLLLSLIARHRLDVTEVALARVTDEFIGYLRGQHTWDLSGASQFLVIAATLLDLKAARLLPAGNVDDAEDLELLEARDLLFARLLQYRAFKDVAHWLDDRWQQQGRSWPRAVSLEPQFAAVLPDLIMQVGPDEMARLAGMAMASKPPAPKVATDHLHGPVVNVREQATVLADRLRRARALSFRDLTADADEPAMVVARFLALLELFREQVIGFEQAAPLADLTVRWTGQHGAAVNIGHDFDEENE